jgi:integrase
MGGKSVRTFSDAWLETTKGEVSPATWAKYHQTTRLFLDSLVGKADQDFGAIRREDVARFRDEQGRRVSASTANGMLKIVRIIFAAAEADGVITKNEARSVKKLKDQAHRVGKRAFTLPELRKLLAICDDEWKSLVLFGFYTGARLGDLAMLTWQNIDLERNEVHYTSRKTRRTVIVPLANVLRAHVEGLPAGDDPKQPLHPRAYRVVANEGRTGTLSRQFGELMAVAGLIAPRTHASRKNGKGRNARRDVSEISFHALRHTAVSLLKSAGVSDAVARDLAGHESAEVSRLYTHIEESAKRSAVNRLPEIG